MEVHSVRLTEVVCMECGRLRVVTPEDSGSACPRCGEVLFGATPTRLLRDLGLDELLGEDEEVYFRDATEIEVVPRDEGIR